MTMKTPLILNLVWAGVAGAAFYTGLKLQNSDGAKETGQQKIRSAVTGSGVGGVAGGAKGVNPALVSKDTAVLEFFKTYGLDSGAPLSPDKLKEAMLVAIRESDPVKSQLMFARLMEEITAENAPAALAMLRENLGGFEAMGYMRMLASKWGEVDPVNAMKELSKGEGRDGRMTQNFVLASWAAKDPKAAMEWLAAYQSENSAGGEGGEGGGRGGRGGRDADWFTMSLINGLARSDVDSAMKFALALENENERTRAAETIAREMIRTGGTEKASAWLASLTDPDMKRGAFQTLSDQIMRGDSAKAAEFIKAHANEEYARGAVGNLADTLARKDVQEGLAFAGELTGKAQARAIGSVVNQWLDQNDGANALDASKYVESLPPGDSRDAGARAIAREVVRDDPQTAIAWASSIADVTEREDALVEVGRRYMREDRTGATAWLAQSGLSAEAQQQITDPRGDWGGFGGGGFGGGGRGFDRGGRGGGGTPGGATGGGGRRGR
jgi:hypothetical protein